MYLAGALRLEGRCDGHARLVAYEDHGPLGEPKGFLWADEAHQRPDMRLCHPPRARSACLPVGDQHEPIVGGDRRVGPHLVRGQEELDLRSGARFRRVRTEPEPAETPDVPGLDDLRLGEKIPGEEADHFSLERHAFTLEFPPPNRAGKWITAPERSSSSARRSPL